MKFAMYVLPERCITPHLKRIGRVDLKKNLKMRKLLTGDDGRIPITMDQITRGKNRRTGVFLHAWLSKNRDMEICLARPY